jgi:hypothetical protein
VLLARLSTAKSVAERGVPSSSMMRARTSPSLAGSAQAASHPPPAKAATTGALWFPAVVVLITKLKTLKSCTQL